MGVTMEKFIQDSTSSYKMYHFPKEKLIKQRWFTVVQLVQKWVLFMAINYFYNKKEYSTKLFLSKRIELFQTKI